MRIKWKVYDQDLIGAVEPLWQPCRRGQGPDPYKWHNAETKTKYAFLLAGPPPSMRSSLITLINGTY
jgi:hypothetical protein